MTLEDLPRLTPRQRIVAELSLSGLTAYQIAAKLGGNWNRNNVAVTVWQARHRLKTGFEPKRVKDVCHRGHPKVMVGERLRCKVCIKTARKLREARDVMDLEEHPRDTRTRIEREIATGKRCAGPCWLSLPHEICYLNVNRNARRGI